MHTENFSGTMLLFSSVGARVIRDGYNPTAAGSSERTHEILI